VAMVNAEGLLNRDVEYSFSCGTPTLTAALKNPQTPTRTATPELVWL